MQARLPYPPHNPLSGVATSREIFWNRRRFLSRCFQAGLGLAAASCRPSGERRPEIEPAIPVPADYSAAPSKGPDLPRHLAMRDVTPREVAGVHNNFYEFRPTGGGEVASLAADFEASPWRLDVTGACRHPRSFQLEELLSFPHEKRLYHFRCVERWAMNVPWVGFPLHLLLDRVQPTERAKWVVFTSAALEGVMPGIARAPHYPWPYREALRLDEAQHDLTLLATGVYDEPLPVQHGAPIRLVVPWKYGYKSAKSLVKIELVEHAPTTFWSEVSAHEYGLLSNVNPNIPHPRWHQRISLWLRDHPVWPTAADRFDTALFNGYESQVAHLYPDEPRTPKRPLRPGAVAR